ncbi:hypothetical protein V7177_01475 [Neobacillus niacini]
MTALLLGIEELDEKNPLDGIQILKDQGQQVLVINAPKSYDEVKASFEGGVHQQVDLETYDFIGIWSK